MFGDGRPDNSGLRRALLSGISSLCLGSVALTSLTDLD